MSTLRGREINIMVRRGKKCSIRVHHVILDPVIITELKIT